MASASSQVAGSVGAPAAGIVLVVVDGGRGSGLPRFSIVEMQLAEVHANIAVTTARRLRDKSGV